MSKIERRQIGLLFSLYVFSNVFSNCLNLRMPNCTVSLFSSVHFHMGLQIACVRRRKITQVAFVWLLSSVSFHMAPQRTWISAGIITQVAFVGLFTIVHFHMCPQMVCPRRCVITQAAFVWLFPTVCFQVVLQNACIGGCIISLVAFVWLFTIVHFQMSPQIACIRGSIITLVTFVGLFATVHFQMSLVEPAWLWESQSRMATPLSMEKFGRIDFSLARWVTEGKKRPNRWGNMPIELWDLSEFFFIHCCGRGSHFSKGHPSTCWKKY